jgi:hypothetical protein
VADRDFGASVYGGACFSRRTRTGICAPSRIREKVRAETSGEEVPDVIRCDLSEGGVVLAHDMTGDH